MKQRHFLVDLGISPRQANRVVIHELFTCVNLLYDAKLLGSVSNRKNQLSEFRRNAMKK
jgi:hypothetical protein